MYYLFKGEENMWETDTGITYTFIRVFSSKKEAKQFVLDRLEYYTPEEDVYFIDEKGNEFLFNENTVIDDDERELYFNALQKIHQFKIFSEEELKKQLRHQSEDWDIRYENEYVEPSQITMF